MAEVRLTIQHGTTIFEPPVEEGIQLEWERSGSPGKLTFTTVKIKDAGMNFSEGDRVCLYYDGKAVFVGYVFTKKRDREQRIEVTCYDQIRYLKNKYTYVFENKRADQIIKALCNDFGLNVGSMEDTLANTGNMFVFYDDAGSLHVRNVSNMISSTLIFEESAENFDYSSSIDDETYNNIVLYYKDDNENITIYSASDEKNISQWGMLRYFESVDTPTAAQNKANSLLKLYNKKTRELKVSGAFGDITVRGGTMIPVKLSLGDMDVSNYMLVEKVVHTFEHDHHTMDLTLEGAWE